MDLEEAIKKLELDEFFTEFGYLNNDGLSFLDDGEALNFLKELKEARIKLQEIERIARESFSNPDTLDINLYRAQALAKIFQIFEYNGATIGEAKEDIKAPEADKDQLTFDDILKEEGKL